MAWFLSITNNAYVEANISSAFAEAKKLGISMHLYGGNDDVGTQVSQMQTALTTKQYNAWMVEAVDPVQECGIVKQAISQGISVMVVNQGLCGNDTWTPGTVSFVGGQTRAVYNQFFNYIFDHNKAGGNVVLFTGPNLNYNTNNAEASFKALLPSSFHVVANQQLDYTTSTAFTAATDILRAHPNVNIIIANYSGMTDGVVRAVQQLGRKPGQIEIYDLGSDSLAVPFTAQGWITMSYPLLPVEETRLGVQVLAQWWQGHSVNHYYPLTADLNFPGSPFITKVNASDFHPEY